MNIIRFFKWASIAILVLMIFKAYDGYSQSLNTLTSKEKASGWKLLFNGKDLDGWHIYLQPHAKPGWSIENGIIKTDFHNGGIRKDLITNGQYKNFELTLEWKISVGGNSGILFDVHEDPKFSETYFTGPEMQVLDNVKAEDNKQANHLAGSLYDLIAADPKFVHPAGEWNTVKIWLKNGHLIFWINDKKVVETQMWNDNWKRLVASSKFKKWPQFATYRQGHIALQYHGAVVWYRNIKIKEL